MKIIIFQNYVKCFGKIGKERFWSAGKLIGESKKKEKYRERLPANLLFRTKRDKGVCKNSIWFEERIII